MGIQCKDENVKIKTETRIAELQKYEELEGCRSCQNFELKWSAIQCFHLKIAQI